MNTGDGLPPAQRDFHAWWSMHVHAASLPSPPRADQLAEWIALSGRFPKRTKVSVTPARGTPWCGVVEDWTQPGSGRLMAVVRPDEGLGAAEPMHVAPRFLTAIPLAVQVAAQPG